MAEKNGKEYGKVMAAILKRKKEKDAIPEGEGFEMVNPKELTEDDREALTAMKAVYEKHLTSELGSEDASFRPSVKAPKDIDVSKEAILQKCIWLTKLQNLVEEVVGQQVFSALSDFTKKQILTGLWIFQVLWRDSDSLSPEATRLLQDRAGGALLYQIRVMDNGLKDFDELNLNEEELQTFSIYLIYFCTAKIYEIKDLDFESHLKIAEKAISNHEHKDPLIDERIDKIFKHFDKIDFVVAKTNFVKYLWTFVNDNKVSKRLEKADYQLLYLIYYLP